MLLFDLFIFSVFARSAVSFAVFACLICALVISAVAFYSFSLFCLTPLRLAFLVIPLNFSIGFAPSFLLYLFSCLLNGLFYLFKVINQITTARS